MKVDEQRKRANWMYICNVLRDTEQYSDDDVAELCRDVCFGENANRFDVLDALEVMLGIPAAPR